MNQLLLQFCTMVSLMNSNINNNACGSAINASYVNSDLQKESDASQVYLQKKVYESIDKPYLYSAAFLGMGADSWNKKEIRISAPLKPIFDNISVDLKLDNQSCSVNKVWSF